MSKLIHCIIVAMLLIVAHDANSGTTYPTSREEIRNLSDEELIQVIELFRTEVYPVALRIWKPLQTQYGINSVEDFKAYFPRTNKLIEEYLSKGGASMAVTSSSSIDNSSSGLGAVHERMGGLLAVKEILVVVSYVGTIYKLYDVAKDVMESRIADDLLKQNPEWQDSDLQKHLTYWAEVQADDVVAHFSQLSADLFALQALELFFESKRRKSEMRALCLDVQEAVKEEDADAFPATVFSFCLQEYPDLFSDLFDGDCPTISGRSVSQASPIVANKNSSSGSPDAGIVSGQTRSANSDSMACHHGIGITCNDWVDGDTGGPGDNGVPPGTPDFDIGPPGPGGCVGPCCDGRPGEAPGGPGDDKRCQLDYGMFVPCSHAF